MKIIGIVMVVVAIIVVYTIVRDDAPVKQHVWEIPGDI